MLTHFSIRGGEEPRPETRHSFSCSVQFHIYEKSSTELMEALMKKLDLRIQNEEQQDETVALSSSRDSWR